MRTRRRWALVLAPLVLAGIAPAQAIWQGTLNDNWSTAANWNTGVVPDANTNVVIPAAAVNMPATYLFDPVCRDLGIQAGASMALPDDFDLDVRGNLSIGGSLSAGDNDVVVFGGFVNDGAFTSNGCTVELTGSGPVGGTSTTTFGDLLVMGGTRFATGPFAVTGDATVEGGATLDIAAETIDVGGDWVSGEPGVSVNGTGTLRFTGDGLLTTLENPVPNVTIVGGTRSANETLVAGDLRMTGGALVVLDNATLTVAGDAVLTGGSLGWEGGFAGLEVLDVAGDATVTCSAGPSGPDARFRCAGDWSSSSAFAMPAGRVELDDPAGTLIGGASPTFPDLFVIVGTRTVESPCTVAGDLVVVSGVTLESEAPLAVGGRVQLGNEFTLWDLGEDTHSIGGDFIANGASLGGNGTIEFDGSGSISLSGASLPNVLVSAGVREFESMQVGGRLEMTGGELRVQDDATLTVGELLLTGGTLTFLDSGTGTELIQVAGDASVSATAGTMSFNSRITCGGSWSGESTWSPTAGVVRLFGGDSKTIGGGTPTFWDLELAGGPASSSADVTVLNRFSLEAGVLFDTTGPVDVRGDVALGDETAHWDMGGAICSVSGDWISAGASATGSGRVELTGNGLLDTGTGTIQSIGVVAGGRTVQSSVVTGDLVLTGGSLLILDDEVLTVQGGAQLTGGTLGWFALAQGGPEVLDVAGNVLCTAEVGQVGPNSVFRCAGSWSSNSSFAPLDGRVELDGDTPTTISGLPPGADPAFHDLVLRGGVREASGEFVLGAANLNVEAGAEFVVDDATVVIPGTVVLVDGTLEVGSGGSLQLGAQTVVNVTSLGNLVVVGASEDPAVVEGHAGGGYLLSVAGGLEAGEFRFSGMGVSGVIVTLGAQIAGVPNDLRAGVFSEPSSIPGAVLLDIRRTTPTSFYFVDFEGDGSGGASNVRTLSGATVTFVNSGGSLAGEEFEQDPLDLVDWTFEGTILEDFRLTPCLNGALVEWETSSEVDVARYLVERVSASGGAFVLAGEALPVGPGSYAFTDTAAPAAGVWFYALSEELLSGQVNQLAEGSVEVWDDSLPAGVTTVGPSGEHATIQAAVDAVSGPGGVVLVEAGTYPSFSVPPGIGSLRIWADGSGAVFVDTSAGPVDLSNLAVTDQVDLRDLHIGGADTGFPGLTIGSSSAVILLEDVVVESGAGFPALFVFGSPATSVPLLGGGIALFRCDLVGEPGLEAEDSRVHLGGGSTTGAELSAGAELVTCGLDVVPVLEGGSTHLHYEGVQPDLELGELQRMKAPFPVQVTGEPGALSGLTLASSYGWVDAASLGLPASTWQMVLFGNLTTLTLVPFLTDEFGLGLAGLELELPADPSFLGAALVFQVWQLVKPDFPISVRFSNVKSVLVLP